MAKQSLWVTGAHGMVGTHITARAQAMGWHVIAPSRAELDLCDRDAVARFAKDLRPDAVVHTAGLVGGIQANIRAPYAFLARNLQIGEAVISSALESGVRYLLNLGSSCMYPRSAPNPLTESALFSGVLEPTNEGYAIAKLAAARLCAYANSENEGLRYKTLIPCNLYGPRDHFDADRSHLIAAIIRKVHHAKTHRAAQVEVWGDGKARREFMHVSDLARAVMKALDDMESLPDLMNVGVGSDHSVLEYYEAVAEVIGWSGSFDHDLSKPVGMQQKLLATNLQEEWGWQPVVSLNKGLLDTYQYFLKECA